MEEIRDTQRRVEPMLAGLDDFVRATLPHIATKAEMAEKPSKTFLWTILGAVALGSQLG